LLDLRDRTIARALYIFRQYEPSGTRLLGRILCPGMTVVDIGANTGYYTILAATIVGASGRVLAFEPSPENAEILKRNIGLNGLGNVVVEESAVTASAGEATLYLCSINAGDHRIYNGKDDDFYNAGRRRSTLHVKAVSLDGYLDPRGARVDLIKMDVQGAEYVALQGMKRTLAENEAVILMTEYWPHGLERSGARPEDFLSELVQLGFRIFRGAPEGRFEMVTPDQVRAAVQGRESTTLFFSRRGPS
jgi:FkbM family methyltransferase